MARVHVLWAASTEMPAGWQIRAHSHTFYHAFYMDSGSAVFYVDGQPYTLKSGGLLIVPPEHVHELPRDTHTLTAAYEVKFTILDEHLKDAIEEAVGRDGVIHEHKASHFAGLLRYIALNWMLAVPLITDNIDAYLSTILTSVCHSSANLVDSGYIDTTSYNYLCKQIIHYIEENYADPFHLSELGKAVGRSANYICSIFKKNTGITIVEYLNYVRIRRILGFIFYADISSSMVTIRTMSLYVGYQNPSHFNRVFKSMTGMTPSAFMKMLSWIQNTDQLSPDKNRFTEYYEEHLGIKIVPLRESMDHMKNLGKVAESCRFLPNQN